MGKPSDLAGEILRGVIEGGEPTVERAHDLAWSVLGAAGADVRLAIEVLRGGEHVAARLIDLAGAVLAREVEAGKRAEGGR